MLRVIYGYTLIGVANTWEEAVRISNSFLDKHLEVMPYEVIICVVPNVGGAQ